MNKPQNKHKKQKRRKEIEQKDDRLSPNYTSKNSECKLPNALITMARSIRFNIMKRPTHAAYFIILKICKIKNDNGYSRITLI